MEQKDCPQPLLWENAIKWLTQKIKEYKIPILTSVIVGFLTYMFAFTNKLVNHDEAFMLFFKGGTLTLGRWGLGALDTIFPNYSMPWIYGVITIALITASICVILHIFHIRSKLLQALLAGSVIACPTLIGTMAYMFTVSSYAVAFLLAVLAVWLLQTGRKWYGLIALAIMILSLSIYQSYVSVAASLLVLGWRQRLQDGAEPRPVGRPGLGYVRFLILSLGLYYVATLVINRLVGVSFNSYANDNMSFDLVSIPADIVCAYQSFFRYLTEGFRGMVPTPLSRWAHYLLLAAVAVLLVFWYLTQTKTELGRIALLAALIALLPLTISCMHLFSTPDSVHTLVLYGFIAVYILAAFVADMYLTPSVSEKLAGLSSRIMLHVITLAMAVSIVVNIYVANEVYLNLYLRYQNAFALYTSLVADLKMQPGFDEDTKLAVIGNYQIPEFYFEHYPNIDNITGTTGFHPDNYSKGRFLEYYLGFSIPLASDEEIQEIAASDEFAQMEVYPYYGSIKMIGDIFVVKLS